jgi:hypothetical protein
MHQGGLCGKCNGKMSKLNIKQHTVTSLILSTAFQETRFTSDSARPSMERWALFLSPRHD